MKRLLLLISIFGMFLLTACTGELTVDRKGSDSPKQLSYVTMDINPSVAFTVNEDDVVISIEALNEDGEVLLANLTFDEPELEEAIQALIDEAIALGYIDPEAEETTVEIDVVDEFEDKVHEVREKVKTKIEQSLKERHIRHRVKEKIYQSDWHNKAAELGISPGHYRLVQHALLLNPELTEEEALEKSVRELVQIINDCHEQARQIALAMKEEYLQAKEAIVEEYLPLMIELEDAIIDAGGDTELIEELKQQLKELRETVKQELRQLHETFKAQSKEYRDSLKLRHEARRQAHMDRVMEHFEHHGFGREWLEERLKHHRNNGSRNHHHNNEGHQHMHD